MSMTPNNFLLLANKIIAAQSNGGSDGVGFHRSHTLNLLTDLRTSGALVLTGATSPLVAALETNALGVQWAAANSSKAAFTFVVPHDYDGNTDKILICMVVNSAGNTDAPTITANVYNKRAGTALSADLAPTASAAIPKSATAATAAAEVIITVTGKSLQAKDVLTVLLAPGTHATDAVNLYSVSIRHKSTLVPYDPTLR